MLVCEEAEASERPGQLPARGTAAPSLHSSLTKGQVGAQFFQKALFSKNAGLRSVVSVRSVRIARDAELSKRTVTDGGLRRGGGGARV